VSRVEWNQARVLLLDIEGTTTPIDFVYKTLFPYASRNVGAFLGEHFADSEVRNLVEELKAQNEQDNTAGLQPPIWLSDSAEARVGSAAAYVQWLIAEDSKCTPLKSLQGKIWQRGFASAARVCALARTAARNLYLLFRKRAGATAFVSYRRFGGPDSAHCWILRYANGDQGIPRKLREDRRIPRPGPARVLVCLRCTKRSEGGANSGDVFGALQSQRTDIRAASFE
jgi:hypothetical protein